MLLEEMKARLTAASDSAESLLIQVHEFYIQDIRSKENLLEDALSDLHNSGRIDIVELVAGVVKGSSDYDFFTVLHVFEKVLPSLNANVDDVLHSIAHLTEQAGRDSSIGGVYGAFTDFCSLESARSRDSIRIILNQSELDTYLPCLSCSILAFHSDDSTEAIQTAIDLCSHENGAVRSQAYFALGRLNADNCHSQVVWESLSSKVSTERDSDCQTSLLRAIINFGEKFPSYWKMIEILLRTLVHNASPEIQYEISNITAFQNIDLPSDIFHLLIEQLNSVSPKNKGTVHNIDFLLVKLVKQNSSPLAVKLLESILTAGVDFQSLPYFSHELSEKHQRLLGQIVTKWFLAGESTLCGGIYDFISDARDLGVEIKADMSLLGDETNQFFACRKAVGWLFTKPVAAASFVLSIYEYGSENLRHDLEQLLYSPLLLSYPGDLKRYFHKCVENSYQEQLCERLIIRLENYHNDLAHIENLKELRAPLENLNAYWKNVDKNMQTGSDEAPKSILMELCTVQNLLYGNSSIYYIHKGDGEQVRQEMEMLPFSHSTEMPTLNVLDPEGLDYTLRIYRCERAEV